MTWIIISHIHLKCLVMHYIAIGWIMKNWMWVNIFNITVCCLKALGLGGEQFQGRTTLSNMWETSKSFNQIWPPVALSTVRAVLQTTLTNPPSKLAPQAGSFMTYKNPKSLQLLQIFTKTHVCFEIRDVFGS